MNKSSNIATPLPIPLPQLIASLQQSTFMANQLPTTSDPNHLRQIYSSLRHTQDLLSSFLSSQPPDATEQSVSSTDEEPMQMGEDQVEIQRVEDSKTSIDMVEERMRDVFIKNKRFKRPISPSSAMAEERRRLFEDGNVVGEKGFDPNETRLRALDLVFQFHG